MDDRLKQIANEQPCPLVFVTISGAHLYGFPSPDSDYDLRGVHILPLKDVIGLKQSSETIDISEVRNDLELDLVTHDVHKFIRLMLKRNGYVLEQLLSPLVIHTTPEHETLKEFGHKCITKHHAHHYLGFSRTQWKLFRKEDPPKVKPLLYVYRILLTGIHLMRSGELEANLLNLNQVFKLPYIDELVELKLSNGEKSKLNDIDIDFHAGEYKRLTRVLEIAHEESHLPDNPSVKEELNDFLVQLRLSQG